MKKLRQALAATTWSAYYRAYLGLHPACRLDGQLRVTGRMKWDIDPFSEVHIASGVRINSGPLFNAIGGHRTAIIAVHRGGKLTIGKRTGLSSCTIVCESAVQIGEDVFVGGGVVIVDSDLHAISSANRRAPGKSNVASGPVVIGDRAFIGAEAIILKGVSIGNDAVVGAGAVIARDIPAGEIWAGNPARSVGQVDINGPSSPASTARLGS